MAEEDHPLSAYYILEQLGQVHYTVVELSLGQAHRGILSERMAKKAGKKKYLGPWRMTLDPNLPHLDQMAFGRRRVPIYHEFNSLMRIK